MSKTNSENLGPHSAKGLMAVLWPHKWRQVGTSEDKWAQVKTSGHKWKTVLSVPGYCSYGNQKKRLDKHFLFFLYYYETRNETAILLYGIYKKKV